MLLLPRFLCGDALTEADVRLFPPIFRFDNVYHLRFRLNEALISESYPHLQRWMEEVNLCPSHHIGRVHGRRLNVWKSGPQLEWLYAATKPAQTAWHQFLQACRN